MRRVYVCRLEYSQVTLAPNSALPRSSGRPLIPYARLSRVALDCLLLIADAEVLKAVKASLSVYEVNLELRKDVPGALELANHRHFHGLVIDCDGVPGRLEVPPKYARLALTGSNPSFLRSLTEPRE
jgi:hypothetical protein